MAWIPFRIFLLWLYRTNQTLLLIDATTESRPHNSIKPYLARIGLRSQYRALALRFDANPMSFDIEKIQVGLDQTFLISPTIIDVSSCLFDVGKWE